MADPKEPQAEEEKKESDAPAAEDKNADAEGKQPENQEKDEEGKESEDSTIPQSKYNQVYARAKKAEAALAEAQAAEAEREKSKLLENEEYTTVISNLEKEKADLAVKAGEVDAARDVLNRLLDAEKAKIPEELHPLIPSMKRADGSDDITGQLDWIAQNSHLFAKFGKGSPQPQASGADLPKNEGDGPPLSELEKMKERRAELLKKKQETNYLNDVETKEVAALSAKLFKASQES